MTPSNPERAAWLRPAATRRVVRFELTYKTLLLALLFAAGAWVALRLVPVVLVVTAALMLVGTLNPVVGWLEGKSVRRNRAIAVVFTAAVVVAGLIMFFTMPPLIAQLQHLAEREPEIRGHAVDLLRRSALTSSLAEQLNDIDYTELLKSSRGTMLIATKRAIEIVGYVVASIFLALYFMIDRDRLRGAVFAIVPRKYHVRFSSILINLETIVGGYIRGQVITSVLMAVFIFVLLLACGVPNALALAVFGGLMDVLPYIGPLLTIAPAVIAAYGEGAGVAAIVFAALVLYEEFESRFLVPWVYGRALRLPSSVVFVSLLAGAVVGGVIGALLALPLAAAIVMLVQELRVELPGEPEPPRDVRLKDAQEVREYEIRAEQEPAKEAAAIAVEIAKERKEEDGGADGTKA